MTGAVKQESNCAITVSNRYDALGICQGDGSLDSLSRLLTSYDGIYGGTAEYSHNKLHR